MFATFFTIASVVSQVIGLSAVAAGTVETPVVKTFVSEEGQSMDAFVLSQRKYIARLANRKGSEVCGGIAKRGNVYVLEMHTGEGERCGFNAPAGYTGQSLHTHPAEMPLVFSAADIKAGPGYLLARGKILHQQGIGTVREVTYFTVNTP